MMVRDERGHAGTLVIDPQGPRCREQHLRPATACSSVAVRGRVFAEERRLRPAKASPYGNCVAIRSHVFGRERRLRSAEASLSEQNLRPATMSSFVKSIILRELRRRRGCVFLRKRRLPQETTSSSGKRVVVRGRVFVQDGCTAKALLSGARQPPRRPGRAVLQGNPVTLVAGLRLWAPLRRQDRTDRRVASLRGPTPSCAGRGCGDPNELQTRLPCR